MWVLKNCPDSADQKWQWVSLYFTVHSEVYWVYPVSSYLLPRCCCSSRQLHRTWLMPPQGERQLSELQKTWASSADQVCSDLSCMLLQCDQSSPVYYSGELPQISTMSPSQWPFPGCSPVQVACGNPPPALWCSLHWAGGGSRFFQVRQWSVQEKDNGVVHSNARLVGKLEWVHKRTHQRVEMGKDQPLQGIHQVWRATGM